MPGTMTSSRSPPFAATSWSAGNPRLSAVPGMVSATMTSNDPPMAQDLPAVVQHTQLGARAGSQDALTAKGSPQMRLHHVLCSLPSVSERVRKPDHAPALNALEHLEAMSVLFSRRHNGVLGRHDRIVHHEYKDVQPAGWFKRDRNCVFDLAVRDTRRLLAQHAPTGHSVLPHEVPARHGGWIEQRLVVKRVLLTGMSGTGKSTVIAALGALGYKALDADEGWSMTAPDGEWLWHEERVDQLLSIEDSDVLYFGGCASNQGKFRSRFDQILLLSAPLDVMLERVRTRTNNPFEGGWRTGSHS